MVDYLRRDGHPSVSTAMNVVASTDSRKTSQERRETATVPGDSSHPGADWSTMVATSGFQQGACHVATHDRQTPILAGNGGNRLGRPGRNQPSEGRREPIGRNTRMARQPCHSGSPASRLGSAQTDPQGFGSRDSTACPIVGVRCLWILAAGGGRWRRPAESRRGWGLGAGIAGFAGADVDDPRPPIRPSGASSSRPGRPPA